MTLLPTPTLEPIDTPFDRFWAAWPKHRRKRDKKTTLARWNREKLDERVEHVLAVLKIDKDKWAHDNNKYVPAPEVWIHKRRWDCIIEDIAPKRSTQTHPLTRQIINKSNVRYEPERQKAENIADRAFAGKWMSKHNKRQRRCIVKWAIKRTGSKSMREFIAYRIMAKVIREQGIEA